jgi:hypothetical protein
VKRSPFPQPTGPSVFAADPAFTARKCGKTQSQIASESVERLTRENGGRSPGEIKGISRAERRGARNGVRTAYLFKTGCQ